MSKSTKVSQLFKKPFVINSDDDTIDISISPAQVPVPPAGNVNQSIITTLVITVLNKGAGTLNITAAGLQLQPDFMVSEADPIAGEPDLWDFTATSEKGVYQASPVNGQSNPLAQGESFTLELKCFVLNQANGDEAINVAVAYEGTDYKTTVHFEKVPASNDHIIESFFADPPNISENESSNLGWVTKGIDSCELVYGDSNPSVPVSIDKYAVNPVFTETYTLIAHATGLVIAAQVTVTVETLQATLYAIGNTTVNYGDGISLGWICNSYTTSVVITCDDANIIIPGDLKVIDKATFGPLIKNTTFQLTASSNDGRTPVYSSVLIVVSVPAINTFSASPDSGLWQKDDVVISWDISSAKSIEISPLIPAAPTPLPNTGKVTVNPESDVHFTIMVTGKLADDGQPIVITQGLNISVELVTIDNFGAGPNPVLPSDKTPDQISLTWAANAQVLSIDQGVGIVTSNDMPKVINSPANNITYILSAGTFQHPVLLTKPITVVNYYRNLIFTAFNFDYEMVTGQLDLQGGQFPNDFVPPEGGYWCTLGGVNIISNSPIALFLGSFIFAEQMNIGPGSEDDQFFQVQFIDPANPIGTIQISNFIPWP